jgi:hypothetical protein
MIAPVELVRAGLATATVERVVAGRRRTEGARERITEAGRRALADSRYERVRALGSKCPGCRMIEGSADVPHVWR